jgi:hypothetical protein
MKELTFIETTLTTPIGVNTKQLLIGNTADELFSQVVVLPESIATKTLRNAGYVKTYDQLQKTKWEGKKIHKKILFR